MAPVKLYVYDLSNGVARNLSFQLTGRQIDGIWHTSVVVFGKEVYYGPYNAGPGIQVTLPGQSHHGQPLNIIDMGETDIDEETFWEYINESQEQYTWEKYHLLDFNCNSFTNDCVGFLTGGSIPHWIKDLPSDFLSTPFGRSMRPVIDNMYRRPALGTAQPTPLPAAASASNAATLTSPIHVSSNPASFHTILQSNKAVVAFFTSDTCAPCRIISPVFKDLAESTNREGVAFVEVNLSVAMSGMIAQEWNISTTPTFLFFSRGAQARARTISELKGVNAPELKSQVNLLLFEAFPPHPHTKLELPVIRSISLNPILYTQPPSYDALHTKLSSFIDAATGISNKASLKLQISDEILPFMKTCFPSSTSKLVKSPHSQTDSAHAALLHVTQSLIGSLPPSELFPLVDLWRIAVLDERIAASLSLAKNLADAPGLIFRQVQSSQDQSSGLPRNLLLTVLRFTSNCFAVPSLARHVLNPSSDTTRSESPRSTVTSILIPALLHEDSAVRTAAASTVFNVATYIQKPLMDYQRNGAKGSVPFDSNEDGEWIVEIVSALIEGLKTEKGNQDVVHRIVASIALLVHLSPHYSETLVPLLEVLQAKDVLAGKLEPGGCGPEGVRSEELRKLIQETIVICA